MTSYLTLKLKIGNQCYCEGALLQVVLVFLSLSLVVYLLETSEELLYIPDASKVIVYIRPPFENLLSYFWIAFNVIKAS